MYYCEKCKFVCDHNFCAICGKRNLRAAADGDFCFLIELKELQGIMLADFLEQEGIPCASVPFGTGVRSAFGLKLENIRIYVPFEFYDKAVAIVKTYSDSYNENMRAELLNGLAKLHVDRKVEKKIKKKLKLPVAEDLISHCKREIQLAEKIVDEGPIIGSQCGHFLFVYTGSEIIIVDSATYEVLDAKLSKKRK